VRTIAVGWLVLAGLLTAIPARAQPPDSPPAATRTIAVDNLAAARLLIELRDWPHAIQVLEASTTADPTDADAWFLLGMARRGDGDDRAAAEAFRQVVRLRPTSPRPYLELGVSLMAIRDFDGAKHAFERGLELADNRVVRRNIRKYLKIIDKDRDVNFWIATNMQPDTNPAAASGQKVVTIGGIPYVLNSPPSKNSTIGAGVVTGLRYAPWLTDTTRWTTELGYTGLHFFGACCSDDNAAVATGPDFQLGDYEITPQAYYRYRLYAGKSYSSEQGGRLVANYVHASWQLGVGAEGGAAELLGLGISGTAARGFLSADYAVSPTLSTGATLRYERDNYPIPSQAFSAPSITLRSTFLGPWELPISPWVTFLRRNYDGATLTSSGVRVDRYWSGGVAVELDFLNIWGMSPSIGVAYENEASNDPLGRFNRITALLGMGKVF
jgi:tetratricopeptide (TPR) repeat protein